MAARVSKEDHAALRELNDSARQARSDLMECRAAINSRNTFKQRNMLTLREVEAVDNDTSRLYKAAGRMFVLSTKADLKRDLEKNITDTEKEIEGLTGKEKHLAKLRERLEAEVAETVKHHRAAMQ